MAEATTLEGMGWSGASADVFVRAATFDPAEDFGAAAARVRTATAHGRGLADQARDEPRPARAIEMILSTLRERFLATHAAAVHDTLTVGGATPLRVEALVAAAARRFPGLTPDADAQVAERRRPLADKHGLEIAQAQLISAVLSDPRRGAGLMAVMRQPHPAAEALADAFARDGAAETDGARIRRDGAVALVELANPRYLNAEDDVTNAGLETCVDLALLTPEVKVGVLRGGAVAHPAYAGQRIFGAGLNLTKLNAGELSYLFFPVRELGFVDKLYRGHHAERELREKPWIGVVDTFAIGGAMQILLVLDRVIAEAGAYLSLPARQEGIVPGAANLRLARFVGQRRAQELIFSGERLTTSDPEWEAVCGTPVAPERIDVAIADATSGLTDSGLISLAANRRALRTANEDGDRFRRYVADYAVDQARCLFDPLLAERMSAHWAARRAARSDDEQR